MGWKAFAERESAEFFAIYDHSERFSAWADWADSRGYTPEQRHAVRVIILGD